MNFEQIQEKWLKTKDNLISMLHSLKDHKEDEYDEREMLNQDEESTQGDYNYESDSETGQRERYQ